MKKYQYRALHTAVAAVWGKPYRCERCNTKEAKRYEWSNKNHTYTLLKKDWWQLCAKCHRRYDRKKFGHPVPWNKGNVKIMPVKICEQCDKKFNVSRAEQRFCSKSCSSTHNGNKPKLIYLLENKLIEVSHDSR